MTENSVDNIEDFASLFIEDIPLMDVRASVEFEQGSFPNAVNIPLLNDKERETVGVVYKQHGQDAAVKLGHELVSGDVKVERLAQWLEFTKNNPKGALFCFRGGMRSHIVQEWLSDNGVSYPLIVGGYKSVRRFLIDRTDEIVNNEKFVIIGGSTGVGKTVVLNQLERSVDLEGFANHRGSSFGGRVEGQPTQINFENAVAIKLLKLINKSKNTIFIEDEGRSVGSCGLPLSLVNKMKELPIVVLEASTEERIARIRKEYVEYMLSDYEDKYGDLGFDMFSDYLINSLSRVKKRLGAERHKGILFSMMDALAKHKEANDISLHEDWIYKLLTQYYDPMYDYQLSKKTDRIIFRGDKTQMLDYCSSL